MAKIKLRRDTAANWTSANPTLALGEPGFETDTNQLKIGDGSTDWVSLSYVASGASLGNLIIDEDVIISNDSTSYINFKATGFDEEQTLAMGTNGAYPVRIETDWEGNTKSWKFDIDGSIEFPDGTVQTTAYRGQSLVDLLLMSNVDGNILYSVDSGTTWLGPIPSGVNNIGKSEVHNGVIVYTCCDYEADINRTAGLYYSTVLGTANLCVGTDSYNGSDLFWNEVRFFSATNKWVAAGYLQGSNRSPVIAYSDNGISWTVSPVDSTLVSTLNPNSYDWQLTDVALNSFENVYVFTGAINDASTYSGFFVTNDLTATLLQSNHVPVQINARAIVDWPVMQYGGPPGYMIALGIDDPVTSWNGMSTSTIADSNNWSSNSQWLDSQIIGEIGYLPDAAEITTNGMIFAISTVDGQIIIAGPGPTAVAIPLAYTTTNFTISKSITPALLTTDIDPVHNEKLVITNANPTDYNGTYYINTNGNGLFNDQALTSPWDTSGFGDFVSGTLTFSHGQFIDALGVSNNALFAGNDDEQVFKSTDLGGTWTQLADVSGVYLNDFAAGSFFMGSAVNTGNFEFDGNVISNADGMFIATDRGTIEIGTALEGVGGPTHFHIAFQDSNVTTPSNELYFGDDFNFVRLNSNGNGVTVRATDREGGTDHNWNFNNDGTTEIPGNVTVSGSLEFVGETKGLFVEFSNDNNVWVNTVTGNDYGVTFAIGNDNYDNSFVYAISADGTMAWKTGLNQISGYIMRMLAIKAKGDYVYVSGYYYDNTLGKNSFFVAELHAGSGVVNRSWVLGAEGVNYVVRDMDVDSLNNPIVVGYADGEWKTCVGVQQRAGSQLDYVTVNTADLSGMLPENNNGQTWQINIDGNWTNVGGINWVPVTVTTVTGSGAGLTGAVRYVRSGGNGPWIYDYFKSSTTGTAYNAGDQLKITGSQLGGTDSTVSYTLSPWSNTSTIDGGTAIYYFSKDDYPNLDQQLVNGMKVIGAHIPIGLTISNFSSASPSLWRFDIVGVGVLDTSVTVIDGDDLYFYWESQYQWTGNWGYIGQTPVLPAVSDTTRFTVWGVDFSTTPSQTWDLRTTLSGQAFVWTPNWQHTYGSDQWETFTSVKFDSSDSSYYLAGNFWKQINGEYHQSMVMKLNTNGSTAWAKYIDLDGNPGGEAGVVLPGNSGSIFVVSEDNNGYAMVTKIAGDQSIEWQSRQTNSSGWNNYPIGGLDTDGNIIVMGSDGSNNNYIISIQKINKDDGSLIWARTIDNVQHYDMYDYYDEDCQAGSVVNGYFYFGSYQYDINNNNYTGLAVKLPTDGTGLGQYDRWIYSEDTDAQWETSTGAITSGNFDSTDGSIAVGAGSPVSSDVSNTGDISAKIEKFGGAGMLDNVSAVAFADGTELTTGFSGILRHSTHGGGGNTTLTADQNGKFLYYYGTNGSSTIYVPSNSDVALPVGFKITIVMDDFNGNGVYVNNNTGNQSAVINATGYSAGTSDYWYLSNNNTCGIYTLLKVDSDRWILDGPNIQTD